MDKAEFEQIVSAVEEVLGNRLQTVFEAIEQMREEFQNTVSVLDGNDVALLAELRKIQHATPAEVLAEAGGSWERFIRGEAEHLGLRVIVAKVEGSS